MITKEKKSNKRTINETFWSVGVKTVDSKNRITLGGAIWKLTNSDLKADAYKVFVGQEGDILLQPVVTIPSREAWIYRNPKVLKKIRKGLVEAKQGKLEKVKDLERFLENI